MCCVGPHLRPRLPRSPSRQHRLVVGPGPGESGADLRLVEIVDEHRPEDTGDAPGGEEAAVNGRSRGGKRVL